MPIQQVIFYFFSALVVFSGLMTIISRNPVQSVLYLVMAFVSSSVLWMLLQAEFLSLVLVFVYVGAVMTLFLFVVMMLNLEKKHLRSVLIKHLPVVLLIVGGMVALLILVIVPKTAGLDQIALPYPAGYSNTKALGAVLYTDYVLPFELAAVLLFIAIIAAISLSHYGRTNRKVQNTLAQLDIRREDRLKIVKMPVNKEWGKE